jgi:hypothetical protein
MIGQRLHVLTTCSDRSLTFTELGMGTAPLGNLYHAIVEATTRHGTPAAGILIGNRLIQRSGRHRRIGA